MEEKIKLKIFNSFFDLNIENKKFILEYLKNIILFFNNNEFNNDENTKFFKENMMGILYISLNTFEEIENNKNEITRAVNIVNENKLLFNEINDLKIQLFKKKIKILILSIIVFILLFIIFNK